MKVIAFTKYSYEGPSSRYRFYNYQKCFKKENINIEILPLFEKEYFKSNHKISKLFIVTKSYIKRFIQLIKIKKTDLVLIEYELFPYFPAFFERLLKKRGIKYIVDYDDAIFHKYDLSINVLVRKMLSNKIPKVMKNASKVICCNNYLKDFALQYNKNIEILHTVVLLDKYIQKQKNFIKKNEGDFIIGWIGSKSTSIYIMDILTDLEKLLSKYSYIKLHLVGFNRALLKESKQIRIIEWSEESEIDEILRFDVGIMPLRNESWSKGKCGFKLIQYMSCKKPVVASPVGINSDIVENGKNGFLVEDNWFEILEKMYLNKETIYKMGEKSFEKVLKDFNYNIHCDKYIKLIKEIICVE